MRIHNDPAKVDNLIIWAKANNLNPAQIEENDLEILSDPPRIRYREILTDDDGFDIAMTHGPTGLPTSFAKSEWREAPMLAVPSEFGLRVI